MNKTVSIEIPAPPDGMEVCGYGVAKKGDFAFVTSMKGFRWVEVKDGEEWVILARKKQTAADWANAQPLLGVLAKMCTGYLQVFTSGFHCMYDNVDRDLIVRAEQCTHEFNGKAIKPVNGKWVDA